MGGAGEDHMVSSTSWRAESSQKLASTQRAGALEELREASLEAFKAANRKGDGRRTLQEYVNSLFIAFDKADTDRDRL